jgi:hypothetical protein
MGIADAASMEASVKASPRYAKYAAVVDRDSAREMLAVKVEEGARRQARRTPPRSARRREDGLEVDLVLTPYRRPRTTAASSPTS